MRFTVSETFDVTREKLFDVIADPRRRPEWQSSLTSVHLKTDGPPGLGTAWYEYLRGGVRFDLEISEFERPARWAERAHGRFADAQLSVRFEPAPSRTATQLRVEVEVTFKKAARLLSPAVRALMPSALVADLRRAVALAQR